MGNLGNLWSILLYQPLLNGVVLFYKLFGNLGWAIVAFTAVLRLVLAPLTLPSLKAGQKMKELAPELEKIKKKFKDDKKGLAEAQMQLYKAHGVNPAAGCLPQIVQIVVLIALYQAFRQVLRQDGGEVISQLNQLLYGPIKLAGGVELNLNFAYLNLSRPDVFQVGLPFPLPGVFLIGAAAAQFVSSKMMMPAVKAEEKLAEKAEESMTDAAMSAQKNMMYLFPVMTLFIGFSFPSGLVLYWLVFSLFQLLQQVWLNRGWSFGRILNALKRRG